MVSARSLPLLVLAYFASALPAGANENYLVTAPQPPALEIGTNFTATCKIINTLEITADDLYWNLSQTTIPKEQYTKINNTTLNVTLTVTGEKPEWLFCLCKKKSANVVLNGGKYIHGIALHKGYRPDKPENLSCIAVQEKMHIASKITCSWTPVRHQTESVPIKYTLMVTVSQNERYNRSVDTNSVEVPMTIFPSFMDLDIWVMAHNKLGTAVSEHLKKDANYFVKTNPPANVTVISEENFPTSLLIKWTRPIKQQFIGLRYHIRFRSRTSENWAYVPHADTAKDIDSFRLQYLKPDTEYLIEVCCKNDKEGHGYWSEWSATAASRTPEDRPTSKPDLWATISQDPGADVRQVHFLSKDPVSANGRIIKFDIMIQHQKAEVKNRSWESVYVNASEHDWSSERRRITVLKDISLAVWKPAKLHVTAINSVGKSDTASLLIPEKAREGAPVELLKVAPQDGRLWLEWKPPNSSALIEYVVEWVNGTDIDWQRENKSTTRTAITGTLEEFVCYRVSVYPIYYGGVGKPASTEAYLKQERPLEAPAIRLSGKPGRNDATLVWTAVPESRRRGFITNYTIFYSSGTDRHEVVVPANTTSYTLTSLAANTKYDTFIRASTVEGSTDGFNHSFTTLKYAPGQIELAVVGVSLSFLFVVVMTMLVCFYKKDMIKRNFWPQIPDPGESTIGNWSPDYPLKAETPKENCLSGISVLDVDDGKCVFEEDKAGLPLKKDKYLSEEHSSGIGGSSCMSSPRQSVSDSDEGGDMADTTASTVQYSSVVASSGYKGQTPGSQPPPAAFSRSESTQPLLDSEEGSDALEGGRLPPPCAAERPEVPLLPLDFCPLEERPEQPAPAGDPSSDWLPVAAGGRAASSYMPQLGGYRPQ